MVSNTKWCYSTRLGKRIFYTTFGNTNFFVHFLRSYLLEKNFLQLPFRRNKLYSDISLFFNLSSVFRTLERAEQQIIDCNTLEKNVNLERILASMSQRPLQVEVKTKIRLYRQENKVQSKYT